MGASGAVAPSLFLDREAQIAAVEKTFEDAKLEITEHYSKKGVTPVEVMHVLPNSDMWKYPCAQVMCERRFELVYGFENVYFFSR